MKSVRPATPLFPFTVGVLSRDRDLSLGRHTAVYLEDKVAEFRRREFGADPAN